MLRVIKLTILLVSLLYATVAMSGERPACLPAGRPACRHTKPQRSRASAERVLICWTLCLLGLL